MAQSTWGQGPARRRPPLWAGTRAPAGQEQPHFPFPGGHSSQRSEHSHSFLCFQISEVQRAESCADTQLGQPRALGVSCAFPTDLTGSAGVCPSTHNTAQKSSSKKPFRALEFYLGSFPRVLRPVLCSVWHWNGREHPLNVWSPGPGLVPAEGSAGLGDCGGGAMDSRDSSARPGRKASPLPFPLQLLCCC